MSVFNTATPESLLTAIKSIEWFEFTYCACCVENFKHTLLTVYLHLLQGRKKMATEWWWAGWFQTDCAYLKYCIKQKLNETTDTEFKTKHGENVRNIKTCKDKEGRRKRKKTEGRERKRKTKSTMTWTCGAAANNQLIPVRHSASPPQGTLTFLYESSIVGSYFSTKIPCTNWTVCKRRHRARQHQINVTFWPQEKNIQSGKYGQSATQNALRKRLFIMLLRMQTNYNEIFQLPV